MLFTVVLCNFISIHYHLANGYWLPLTAFLIIKSNHAISISRNYTKVIGTLIGGGVALACCLLIHSQLIFALMIFFFFLSDCYRYIAPLWFIYKLCLHYRYLLTIALMNNEAMYRIEYRVIYTLLAVLIVMIFLYALKFILTKVNVHDQ